MADLGCPCLRFSYPSLGKEHPTPGSQSQTTLQQSRNSHWATQHPTFCCFAYKKKKCFLKKSILLVCLCSTSGVLSQFTFPSSYSHNLSSVCMCCSHKLILFRFSYKKQPCPTHKTHLLWMTIKSGDNHVK